MAVDPILTNLQYEMEASQELDILNFHKGFPITCKAQVEAIVRGDTVVLRVQPPGSICLEAQDHTIVLSRGLPEAVRASIRSFDLLSGRLELTNFSYVGAHFGERMIARVQPEDTLTVKFEVGESIIQGTLIDVSLSGVGILTGEHEISRGQILLMTLPLPEGKVTLPGKVLNITAASQGKTRLSIGFTRSAQEVAVVMRYIKDRRSEILSEIERMYERSYHQKLAQAKNHPE